MAYITRSKFDELNNELFHKCDMIMEKPGTDGHIISSFVADWAKRNGLSHLDMPNVFGTISGKPASNSQVYLGVYKNASWRILEDRELSLKLRVIKAMMADAIEKDKDHFAQLKLAAIAEAQAAALAFA